MALLSRKKDDNSSKDTNMNTDGFDTTILEMLASRICHDIISPVGAVHNGVEFLQEMGPDAGDEAVELLAHSASMASAKLLAFRMAYGAGGKDPNIKPEDVYKAFEDLIKGDGKVTQDWDPHAPLGFEERPDAFCKMLMGTMMLALECLPKGGNITVREGAANEVEIVAKTEHETLVRPQVEDALALNVNAADLDPRLVHPYAIALLARNYNYGLNISENTQSQVVFSLRYP